MVFDGLFLKYFYLHSQVYKPTGFYVLSFFSHCNSKLEFFIPQNVTVVTAPTTLVKSIES